MTTSNLLAPPSAARRTSLPPHKPGAVRDYVEKTGGVVGAVGRVPGSFLSGVVIGGFHGCRRGLNPEYRTDPAAAATGIVVSSAAQGLVTGALTAFALLGPVGAAASLVKDGAGSAFSTYMFIKGGSAAEMGRRLASDIDGAVTSDDGAWKGLLKGAWAGGLSTAKGAAVTGFYEGRAATSGLYEGASQLAKEVAKAKAPSGGVLKRIAATAAATVGAIVSAPAGLAHALLAGRSGEALSKGKRLAVAALNGALLGGAAGFALGPVGLAVGGAAGAVIGLATPAAGRKFAETVSDSLREARSNDGDLGHEITNKRRDLVQALIAGTSSGARSGWNAAVETLAERPLPPAVEEG